MLSKSFGAYLGVQKPKNFALRAKMLSSPTTYLEAPKTNMLA